MSNNLRVIYNNIVDTASISANSTASAETPATNLKNTSKSKIWSSATVAINAPIILTVTFTAAIVGGIIFPYCNFSPSCRITAVGTLLGSTKLTATNVLCSPYIPLGQWSWGTQPLGINMYSYGGSTCARLWFDTQEAVDTITITITDPERTQIEASRLVIGSYWSPKFNTSYGLSTNSNELSEHNRAESGELITKRGAKYNTMSFELKYMNSSDRLELTNIIRGNGMPKPLFISLFPNDTDIVKEQGHQIYGKLVQLPGISHSIYEMYSTSLEIEEV